MVDKPQAYQPTPAYQKHHERLLQQLSRLVSEVQGEQWDLAIHACLAVVSEATELLLLKDEG